MSTERLNRVSDSMETVISRLLNGSIGAEEADAAGKCGFVVVKCEEVALNHRIASSGNLALAAAE